MHKEIKTEFFVYDKVTKQAISIAGLKEMKPNVYTVTDSEEAELTKDGEQVILDYYEVKIGKKE